MDIMLSPSENALKGTLFYSIIIINKVLHTIERDPVQHIPKTFHYY